jgi:hypothetical protein
MAMTTDAFTVDLAELRAYANSLTRRVLAQTTPTASRACPSGTWMEGTGLVPSSPGDAGEHTTHSPSEERI